MLLKVFTQRLNVCMLDMLLYPGSKEWGMDKVAWKIPVVSSTCYTAAILPESKGSEHLRSNIMYILQSCTA